MTRTASLKFHTPKKRVKRYDRPEARMQKALVQIILLTVKPGVLWFSIPNEGKRSKWLGAELKLMGLRPGAADLCFIRDGKIFFMELKAAGEKQSPAQIAFAGDCLTAGAAYWVADNFKAAVSVLKLWGIIQPGVMV